MRTRSLKILRDILARKGRTTLVVLSILIGVFGVTILVSGNDLIVKQLDEDLKAEHIATTHIYMSATGGHISLEENRAYLEQLEQLPGVQNVEGQAVYPVSWRKAGSTDSFNDGNILAYTEPFGNVQLEPVTRVTEGRYPDPGKREIVVEQRFAEKYDVEIGDKLVFRLTDTQEWEVVGLVFHPYFTLSLYSAQGNILPEESIYANYPDAQEIANFPGLSSIYARYDSVESARDGLDAFTAAISTQTPYTPVYNFLDDPENNYILKLVRQVTGVMNMLAVISMVVSGFLVTNVINTVVVEQKRQIGVMKSLGATRWDSFCIYAGMALVYGLIGTVIGVALAIPAAAAMVQALAPFANTMIDDFRISTTGILVGVGMGLLVPMLAALLPVYNGTRVTILEAITDLGISSNWGRTRLSRFIGALPVPITIRQALSNIAGKKGRLALTGLTLTLAVAAFMGVTAVFTAIGDTLDRAYDTYNYEILITTQDARNYEQMRDVVMRSVENVSNVFPGYGVSINIEGYKSKDPLTAGSSQFSATGIDPASPVIAFDLAEGTGWEDDPTRRGVILTRPLAETLNKESGDTLTITVNGVSYVYEIIGIDRLPFDVIFFDWRELATIAGYTDENGDPLTSYFFVALAGDPDFKAVDRTIDTLEETLLADGIQAVYTNQPKVADTQAQQFTAFGMIFNISSAVMAAVGAIGLLAVLSMAVYERQKEIGVMRSIGAGSGTIVTQFLIEGLMVGAIAWLMGIPISFLIGTQLTAALGPGEAFQFEYPLQILVFGLVSVLLVAAIASIWPSVAAARKTVSDILRYQ